MLAPAKDVDWLLEILGLIGYWRVVPTLRVNPYLVVVSVLLHAVFGQILMDSNVN